MSRMSITEFRARLAKGGGNRPASPLVQAYVELARRPEVRQQVVAPEWAPW